MAKRRYVFGASPELYRSIPAYLHVATQRASNTPYLYTSTLHARIALTELRSSIHPRRYGCNATPDLHSSIRPYLHACSAPPDPHTSTSRHLQRAPAASELRTSM